MQRGNNPPRRYEEHAYVLDFDIRGRSCTVRGREGIMIIALGEDKLTLLEILGVPDSTFEIAEKIYIGKKGRIKALSVLGKMTYKQISNPAKNELPFIIDTIVNSNKNRFLDYINNAQPLTPRIHTLELIPGIGKIYTKIILEEREKKKFESFEELQERVRLKEPLKNISQRILEEISGETRINLFVKR